MRKYEEFKRMWLGKQCRDGQCVSLFREYTEGFHDTPILERLGVDGGALGLFTRYDKDVGPVSRKVFGRAWYIKGSGMRPNPGDVVIFGATATNRYGHVGIMDEVLEDRQIAVLDQNGIAALRGEEVKVKISHFPMERVLGWLVFNT